MTKASSEHKLQNRLYNMTCDLFRFNHQKEQHEAVILKKDEELNRLNFRYLTCVKNVATVVTNHMCLLILDIMKFNATKFINLYR